MSLGFIATGANNIGLARAIRIQSNSAATGAITVTTAGSTQYGTTLATQATITNPLAGAVYEYGGLHGQGAVSINVSVTCDISVTKLNQVS